MNDLSLGGLLGRLREASGSVVDPRKGANKQYALGDVIMGAFSVFYTQYPSFLEQQKQMQTRRGKNNAQTIFGISEIASDNQTRNILDEVPPERLFGVFDDCFQLLATNGYLDQFRVSSGDLLLALDGTWYCASEKICCASCLTKTNRDKTTTYYHSMLTPVIIAPGKSQALVLPPEMIMPQDGHDKQDCENAAAKRWSKGCGKRYASFQMTVVADDLYSRQPVMKELCAAGLHYVLVCKEDSHPTLYQWVHLLKEGEDRFTKTVRVRNGAYHELITYHWANTVPIRDTGDAIRVGWCEVTIVREKTEEKRYHNAFVCDRIITEENVEDIVLWGRTRWKVENESNNTLKTKGYHLEHNYGHGEKYLAAVLATMTLLAFLFHTILELSDKAYQELRSMLSSRIKFFNDLRALTTYWCFDSWDDLISFMIRGLKEEIPAPG